MEIPKVILTVMRMQNHWKNNTNFAIQIINMYYFTMISFKQIWNLKSPVRVCALFIVDKYKNLAYPKRTSVNLVVNNVANEECTTYACTLPG
jgi:hypothetical protein